MNVPIFEQSHDDQFENTAYHEAGHALMAVLVGARVRSLTITPDRDDGPLRYGDAQIEWDHARFASQRELHEKSVLVTLGGPVAEMIYRSEPFHPGLVAEWAADWQQAWKLAQPLVPDERKRLAFLETTTVELHRLLSRDDHWAALAAIVDSLLAHEWLEGDDVEEIVRSWLG